MQIYILHRLKYEFNWVFFRMVGLVVDGMEGSELLWKTHTKRVDHFGARCRTDTIPDDLLLHAARLHSVLECARPGRLAAADNGTIALHHNALALAGHPAGTGIGSTLSNYLDIATLGRGLLGMMQPAVMLGMGLIRLIIALPIDSPHSGCGCGCGCGACCGACLRC